MSAAMSEQSIFEQQIEYPGVVAYSSRVLTTAAEEQNKIQDEHF